MHEGAVSIHCEWNAHFRAGGLSRQALKRVVRCCPLRPDKRCQCARQRSKQRLPIGVLAVGERKNFVTQSLKLPGNYFSLCSRQRSATCVDHQFTEILQGITDISQRAFGLGYRIALRIQRPLVCVDAAYARQRALGLGCSSRVVAGGVDALTGGQLLLRVHQLSLTRHEVVARCIVGVSRTKSCK